MKKTVFLLIAACLFISFVMFKLMDEGVFLRERRMIKWSKVNNMEEAGAAISRHLYPLLKEEEQFLILGLPQGAASFVDSFKKTISAENIDCDILHNQISLQYKGYVLQISDLLDHADTEACLQGDRFACVQNKALKKINKKSTKSGELWIQMWRMSDKKIQVFFKRTIDL